VRLSTKPHSLLIFFFISTNTLPFLSLFSFKITITTITLKHQITPPNAAEISKLFGEKQPPRNDLQLYLFGISFRHFVSSDKNPKLFDFTHFYMFVVYISLKCPYMGWVKGSDQTMAGKLVLAQKSVKQT
jgi:hypothetical protein